MLVPVFDLTVHLSEFCVLAAVSWRVIKTANRILDVLKDFPPHRHISGKILYPDAFEPTVIESLHVSGKG